LILGKRAAFLIEYAEFGPFVRARCHVKRGAHT
jgi:hypothetical protein